MLYFLGLTLLVAGGVLTIPAPISLIFGEPSLAPYFLIPAAISFLVGGFLYSKFESGELTFGKAMVIAALGWLIVPLIGSIPYILGSKLGPLDAYFESMSGFTTTGLTMFKMPGPGFIDAPRTILFWRSFSQWVGGVGVMVLFLAAIIGAGKVAKQLYSAEGGGGRSGPDLDRGPEATVRASAKSIWKIYVFYTLVAFIILYLLGMPPFESINHAMTALATGGFSVTSDSFASYGAPILVFTCLPMIFGATSFALHRRVIAGDWRALFKSPEFRLMSLLILGSTLILAWRMDWITALFSTVTASTTVGFSSVNVISGAIWGPLQKSILIILMIIGGGFGSTAGAIKLIRTVILITALYWLVKRALLPDRAVVPLKIGDKIFSENEILQSAVFVFGYFVLLGVGGLITMAAMPEASAINCFFDSVSAQGTVGLTSGVTGPTMPSVVKITYILQMWIGRLEVIPAIALFAYVIGLTPRRRDPF